MDSNKHRVRFQAISAQHAQFLSSSWGSLPQQVALVLDDEWSSSLESFSNVSDNLGNLTGWQFDILKRNANSFPMINKLLEVCNVGTLEELFTAVDASNDGRSFAQQVKEEFLIKECEILRSFPIFAWSKQFTLAKSVGLIGSSTEYLSPNQKSLVSDFLKELEAWIDNLKSQERNILSWRVTRNETLAVVGERIGVTRERVRQIEKKIYSKLALSVFFKSFAAHIVAQTKKQGKSLNRLLKRHDLNASEFISLDLLAHCLNQSMVLRENGVNLYRMRGEWVLGSFQLQDYERLKSLLLADIKSARLQEITMESIFKYRPRLELPLDFLLLDCIGSVKDFDVDEDGRVTPNATMSTQRYLAYLLRTAEKNSWTRESFRQYAQPNNPLGKKITDSQISNAFEQENLQIIDRGTYARSNVLQLEGDVEKYVLNVIDALIQRKGADRQWHSYEVFSELERQGKAVLLPYKQYSIRWLIKNHPEKYRYLGRNVFVDRQQGASNRIEIEDVVTRILDKERKPMNLDDLLSKIEEFRGLGEFKQIHATGLIRKNGWGQYYLSEYQPL